MPTNLGGGAWLSSLGDLLMTACIRGIGEACFSASCTFNSSSLCLNLMPLRLGSSASLRVSYPRASVRFVTLLFREGG